MQGLVHLHNLLRWVILILLIWSLVNSFLGKNGKEARFLTILSHTMLLLGLIQWIKGGWWEALKVLKTVPRPLTEVQMQSHKLALEHPITMIIAIALITIAGVRIKRGKAGAKWLYLVALLLILAMIPWFRPLMPGMHA